MKGLFECPGTIHRVSDENTRVSGEKVGLGFVYIEWADKTTSWQLLRAGYYNHNRPAGWRIPNDDEDAALDDKFEFEDDEDGSDDEQSSDGDEHDERSSDDDENDA